LFVALAVLRNQGRLIFKASPAGFEPALPAIFQAGVLPLDHGGDDHILTYFFPGFLSGKFDIEIFSALARTLRANRIASLVEETPYRNLIVSTAAKSSSARKIDVRFIKVSIS
jgi:hypothetical protein